MFCLRVNKQFPIVNDQEQNKDHDNDNTIKKEKEGRKGGYRL